jgi:MOSC domain-containing protein YiiM
VTSTRPEEPKGGELLQHRSADTLAAGLDGVRRSPKDRGTVELIVRRPAENEREVLEQGALDLDEGLVGDTWGRRGTPNPDAQLTLMNARAAALIAGDRHRWPLAGDQLYVDLDLGVDNLPAGARLAIGGAVVEITAEPHTGCAKFRARFGSDALRFINGAAGRPLRLRGVNARVVEPGPVALGDAIVKL